jgi:non-specific serine/threonine protein kinase/serine/threonine-protein kinase
MATLPGAAIGPYKLVRQLGEGGMGVVYHAQQTQPIRRDVALKVIKPGMDSKQVIARFDSERQALAMMDHTNIARVFDAGTTAAGLPYFVMELVDGVPITRYCDSKRLTLKERIELFIPVCQAIQHAHQKGIIHRDIKPSNVLVKQEENQAVPKVIDFGLAKALGEKLSDATMFTSFGEVVGTLQYMSPEQAELGRRDIDTRSDVYSLGALLYELLTGTTPLEYDPTAKSNYLELLQRIREEEPKPPSTRLRRSAELKDAAVLRQSDPARLPKLLDRELDWIVMKALEKDRKRRYETINGMARDLQRYLAGDPLEAAPPSTAYRMGKFVRRHRLWLATAATFIALLVAGGAVSTWMAVRASRAEQEARAVNDFLRNDLLAQASASRQTRANTRPDPHLEVRTTLDRAAARIEGKFGRHPLVEASIRQTIGSTYTDLGLYPEAQRHLEIALELRRRVLGENDLDTLTSMDQLAKVLERQGKLAKAEPLYIKVLETRRRLLGAEHPETLKTIYSLGATYGGEGKYALAEGIYTTLVAIQRRVLGEENLETLTSMGNLAAMYHFQGKYARAEPVYLKTLELLPRVSRKEDPESLLVLGNLAELYRDQTKYAQAEPLYVEALQIQRRVLGESHTDTIYTMNSLAGLYGNEGNYARAEALYAQALEAGRRGPGADHPRTLDSMNGLADIYRRQGNYTQAAPLYTKILEARKRVLGEEHPATLNTLISLGHVRLLQKEYTEAELALRDALKKYEKAGQEIWERYNCQSMLGASLAGQRRYAEAEPLLLSGYQGLAQLESTIPAPDRSSLEEAVEPIVRLYESGGKSVKAAEWKRKLQETRLANSPKRP